MGEGQKSPSKGAIFVFHSICGIIALGEERQSLLEGDIFIGIKIVSLLEHFLVFLLCVTMMKRI